MAVTINASTSTGLVQSADTSGQIELQTNGTTVATVNTSNNVQFRSSISVGNATPTTSGAGITFPATQSASTDANTLDDYEEGTWTPVISGNTGSLTSYTSSGFYTKVGRLVYITGVFTLTNVGTAGSSANISGLPFTSFNTNFPAGNRSSLGICREDANTGQWYFFFITSNQTAGQMTTASNGAISWTNNYSYIFTATYQAA